MEIILKRCSFRPDTVDGEILIDGEKVCDCAENAHHCLPRGEYNIVLARSRRHARKMPVIIWPEVGFYMMSRSSALIEYCNGVYALTTGSIVVGQHLVPGIVTHSRTTFDMLYQRIRKSLERGNKVSIVIC